MKPKPRHLLSWKTWFYGALLPSLGRLGPSRRDAALAAIGRALARRPGRSRRLSEALAEAREALGAGWSPAEVRPALAANLARFAARDYVLSGLGDAEAIGRFDASGVEHLDAAMADGRGAILLGSHFGGYLAGIHWLARRRVPARLMVQRPHHVSIELDRWFDLGDGDPRHPQSGLFLRRSMPPGEGVERVLRARSALRDGLAVYINGDVAGDSGCSRPGTLLGRRAGYLSAWADLAAVTGAPVLPFFCAHRPGGRFALTIDPPWRVGHGDQHAAVGRYLDRLEAAIAAEPAEAVAHLLWPSFGVSASRPPRRPRAGSIAPALGGIGPRPSTPS